MTVFALDKDTIVVDCEDEVSITTEDTIVFTESWQKYDQGDAITVEPIKDMGEIQLLVRRDSTRLSEAAIVELVCNEIVTIQS